MTSSDNFWSSLKRRKLCPLFYLFYWVECETGRGGVWLNCNMKFWIVKRENMNENSNTGIEVGRIFDPNSLCSCLEPLSPPVKGDDHDWSDTCLIRHGAVMCRIVNWEGLNAYNVTSPLNILTKVGAWLPRTICGTPPKGENCVLSIIYFIEWTAKGGGGRLNSYMKFCMVKRENVNENDETWIEVGRIIGPNSVSSCLGT